MSTEAMKQALEALDSDNPDIKLRAGIALRQAIAEAESMKCIVKNCKNHSHEGRFVGNLCSPCYEFVTKGQGVYSQIGRAHV